MTNKVYTTGMLDQRVILQRPINTPDDIGGNTQTVTDIATVWAMVRPLKASELVHRERLEQQVDYLCVVRQPLEVLPGDLIAWHGYALVVQGIKITPRSAWLELECVLGAAQ